MFDKLVSVLVFANSFAPVTANLFVEQQKLRLYTEGSYFKHIDT